MPFASHPCGKKVITQTDDEYRSKPTKLISLVADFPGFLRFEPVLFPANLVI
jgi:hypothetical protein